MKPLDIHFPIDEKVAYLLAALSLPHLWYLFVWTQAGAFTRLAKKLKLDAFTLFYKFSVLLKFVQLGGLIAWGALSLSNFNITEVSPFRWVLAVSAFGFGQILNMGVYKALGKEGVYYGVKLGRPIEWYEGFPFTVVPHPQYVGCVLCIWGVVAFFFTQAAINSGLLTIATAWTSYYFFTACIEHFF